MKLPRSLRVLGRRWAVEDTPGLAETTGLYGDCALIDERIRVAGDSSEQCRRDTLLHEVIHAVDFTLDMGMTERQVANLATGLLAALRDNPKFTEFLLAK